MDYAKLIFGVMVVTALALTSGCTKEERTVTGVALGAGTGALIGGAAGGGAGGVIGGAAVGGLLGGVIGHNSGK
jgi:uncharacterized membrane protein